MNQALAIAASSIREHSRRRLIAFFVVASLLLASVLGYLTIARLQGNPLSIPVNVAANNFMGFLALVAALAVSMGNIGRPFSDGEALLVLARPVARWQYAAGRLLGSIAVIGVLCALIAAELQVVRVLDGASISAALWRHWGIQWFNLTVVASVATLLSAVIANPVIVAVSAYFIDSFTGGVATLHRGAELSGVSGGLRDVIRFLWYITPKKLNSSLFSEQLGVLRQGAATRILEPFFANSPGLILWAVSYLAGMAGLAMFLAGRKEV